MTQPRQRAAARAIATSTSIVLSTSCSPGGPTEPELSTATVSVVAARDAAPTAPLRIAVVWRRGDGAEQQWQVTSDAPLRPGREQQMTLALPRGAERFELSDASTVYVRCAADATVAMQAPTSSQTQAGVEAETIAVPVVLPRIVVYEDVDRNGRFDPDLPPVPGVDRLWGINEVTRFPIVAFRDLEETLSSLPLEAAECLRGVTGGTYSEFFQVNARAPLEQPLSTIRVFIHLAAMDYARLVMTCSYQNEEWLVTPRDTVAETLRWWIDASLGADLCFDKFASCTLGDAITLSLPDVTDYSTLGYVRRAQCYVFGTLDVLSHTESQLVCEGCRCHWEQRTSNWIIDKTKAPAQWPCGTTVQYCSEPAASLWAKPTTCTLTRARPE